MGSLRHLREAVRDHVLRSTIRPDAEQQKLKQAKAVELFEQAKKEKADYLASLEIQPPTSTSGSSSTPTSARLKKFHRQQKTRGGKTK